MNGAQTINTLARFIEDLERQPDYKAHEKILKNIEVIGKIITNCSQEFVTQITISNNRQNPVESWNLRANDMIQLEFDDKFRQDGIFYERQENSFANLRDADMEELGIEQHKEIKIVFEPFLNTRASIRLFMRFNALSSKPNCGAFCTR